MRHSQEIGSGRDDYVVVSEAELTAYGTLVLAAAGLREQHARQVAENLVLADMRGVDSHGVTRIPIYAKRIQEGVINNDPEPSTKISGISIVNVDGDNGPGAVVGHYALDRAMELAERSGVGISLVRNSNHFGICADYALRAVDRGFVAIVATNAPTSMAIWGAGEPFLGTNPFAFAAPVEGKPPIVLDFASSVVARGKIVERAKRGDTIPEGWALDKDGVPTTDARAAEAGIVLPFAGPKGSGIAIMVEALCGALAGAAMGPSMGNLYKDFSNPQNTGHFICLINPRSTRDGAGFSGRMGGLATMAQGLKTAAGFSEVLLPGEPEYRLWNRRRKEGVPVLTTTVEEIDKYSEQFSIRFPVGNHQTKPLERQVSSASPDQDRTTLCGGDTTAKATTQKPMR